MAQSGPSAALRFCVPNYGDKFIGGMDCCLNATPSKEIKIAVDAPLEGVSSLWRYACVIGTWERSDEYR
jgi:hypothetical protein